MYESKKYSIYRFTKDIKDKFLSLYNNFWNDYRERTLMHRCGKLLTYFSFKTTLGFEEYLRIKVSNTGKLFVKLE